MKCWICKNEMMNIGETDILKDVGGGIAIEYKCNVCGEIVYAPIKVKIKRKFYHGTYEGNYEKINKEGYIDNFAKQEETTTELNELINSYTNSDIRDGCVYLTDDNECTYGYDYAIDVNESLLNTNLLYVADNGLLDEIYAADIEGKKKLRNHLLRKYARSIIPYEKFLKVEDTYRKYHSNIEFLYYGRIYIKSTPKPNRSI